MGFFMRDKIISYLNVVVFQPSQMEVNALLCVMMSLGFLLGRRQWATLCREKKENRLPCELIDRSGDGWFDFCVCSFI